MSLLLKIGVLLITLAFVAMLILLPKLIKRERERQKKVTDDTKKEFQAALKEKENKFLKKLKTHKKNVRQYVKSKTKKALKALRSGQSD